MGTAFPCHQKLWPKCVSVKIWEAAEKQRIVFVSWHGRWLSHFRWSASFYNNWAGTAFGSWQYFAIYTCDVKYHVSRSLRSRKGLCLAPGGSISWVGCRVSCVSQTGDILAWMDFCFSPRRNNLLSFVRCQHHHKPGRQRWISFLALASFQVVRFFDSRITFFSAANISSNVLQTLLGKLLGAICHSKSTISCFKPLQLLWAHDFASYNHPREGDQLILVGNKSKNLHFNNSTIQQVLQTPALLHPLAWGTKEQDLAFVRSSTRRVNWLTKGWWRSKGLPGQDFLRNLLTPSPIVPWLHIGWK